MATYNETIIETTYGNVTVNNVIENGTVSEVELSGESVFATNGNNDGPYFENTEWDWTSLAAVVSDFIDEPLFGFLEEFNIETSGVTDETNGWAAWTTDNEGALFASAKAKAIEAIKAYVNGQYEGEGQSKLHGNYWLILDVTKKAYDKIADGESIDDAIEAILNDVA